VRPVGISLIQLRYQPAHGNPVIAFNLVKP